MMADVRRYKPSDRASVRRICCETGFMGDPVDRLFSDRKLFADFFTAYYTDIEPEQALVAEHEGQVVGYILCCSRHPRYILFQTLLLAGSLPRLLAGLLTGAYSRSDMRFLRWFMSRSARETPRAPKGAAHFHINLLPEHRNNGTGRRLFTRFIRQMEDIRVAEIYGQIQTYARRRPDRVFERFGFTLFDRRRVSKFADYGIEDVYVSTYSRRLHPSS